MPLLPPPTPGSDVNRSAKLATGGPTLQPILSVDSDFAGGESRNPHVDATAVTEKQQAPAGRLL